MKGSVQIMPKSIRKQVGNIVTYWKNCVSKFFNFAPSPKRVPNHYPEQEKIHLNDNLLPLLDFEPLRYAQATESY